MTDEPRDTASGYDPDHDIKHNDPMGMTRTDIDQPASDDDDDGKPQEDLDAEDLKGFVKDPLEQ